MLLQSLLTSQNRDIDPVSVVVVEVSMLKIDNTSSSLRNKFIVDQGENVTMHESQNSNLPEFASFEENCWFL